MKRAAVAPIACIAICVACTRGEPARPAFDAALGTAPAPRGFMSGTRLHARTWVAGDVIVLRDFDDVVLGAPCSFELPGATRACFPVASAIHREAEGPYADANCTDRRAATLDGTPATYAIVTPADSCAGTPSLHRAGPSETLSVYFRQGGRCVRALGALAVQPLGDEVPLDRLVHAHEESEPRPGRIDARVLVADDGARVVVAGFDRARGEVVLPNAWADGTLRWLPSRIAFRNLGVALPPECAQAATKIASSAECPLSAALDLEGSCGGGTFYALGAPLASCGAGLLAFQVGAAIAPSSFARASYADLGAGRVRRRTFDDVLPGDLVDAASGEPCAPRLAADGALRCLPAREELVAYFADDACTIPAFAHALTGCEDSAFATLVHDGARAFEATGEAPALYELRGDACAPFTPVVRSRSFAARELPPSRFAVLREAEED